VQVSIDINSAFDNVATKTVTFTDKDKGAYVPTTEQRAVLSAAGVEPGEGGENATVITIEVVGDPEWADLETSYYGSMRHGAGRRPEIRIGRDFIHWAEIGDEIAIGNIGDHVYAWKASAAQSPIVDVASKIAATADAEDLLERARKAKGKPAKQSKTVSDFKRNVAVVAGALARADGSCEMPNCMVALFQKDDGTTFLEVHHIIPLAEDGNDELANAAAICPMCHRELHYGSERLEKREILKNAIEAKEP
jgi:hypothetical protein